MALMVSASPVLSDNRVVSGKASTYGPGYNGYFALPEGRGVRVRICSTKTGRCLIKVSNDAGPDKKMQRQGRIADLDVKTFEYLCGCSWRVGLIPVTVEYLGKGKDAKPRPKPEVTPPPTDVGDCIECLLPWVPKVTSQPSSRSTMTSGGGLRGPLMRAL